MGITFHIDKNQNSDLYKNAFGKKKRLAMNFGVAVTTEYMFYPEVSVKIDQALFRDCAGKLAGMTMFNFRYTVDLRKAGNASAGLGPFFYYRKNWNSFGNYINDGYFKDSKNGKWQTKLVWYGGELEYNFPLGNGLDLSTNILPGIPVVIALTPGVRMKISQ